MPKIKIGRRWIGDEEPTYFVADIGANHDGSLERAKELIRLAKEAGADAVKFQNFRAPHIVSKYGFESMKAPLSHQKAWGKSVYEVYQEASLPWEWTPELKKVADQLDIDYFTAPYDVEAVDMIDPFVSVFKIGSGDITWIEMLQKIAGKGKSVILSTGASDIGDVQRAVRVIRSLNSQLVLMQCNTNYTGSVENFKHIHLKVLQTYRVMFPEVVLGLSDHTSGYATALGAVALGARVIEKHFTDDNARKGPDHPFAMTPGTWKEMVQRTHELEYALGCAEKVVTGNEQETVIVQRRCLRAASNLPKGTRLERTMIEVLRPAPPDSIFPYDLDRVLGRCLRQDVVSGEHVRWDMLQPMEGK